MNDMNTMIGNQYAKRIAAVRALMARQNVQACIILTADPHMSEYLPTHWQGRAWLSGFTGSVGTLVITQNFAGLWTDSRYWVQAVAELAGSGIELKKMTKTEPTVGQYLADCLADNSVVLTDGAVLSVAEFEYLHEQFAQKNIALRTDMDILATLWADRDDLPNGEIYPHGAEFIDVSAQGKLSQVRAKMAECGADWHLISSLDDIAWLVNLRGSDVAFNPVFLSHLLIGRHSATLFVESSKLSEMVKAGLAQAGVAIAGYREINEWLAKINGSLLIDPQKVAIGTLGNVPKTVQMIKAMNPSTVLKAIKTPKEIAHIRQAMRADGVALCEFFTELEACLAQGDGLTEVNIDTMLTDARRRQPHYVSASFDTIAGFGANGAVVHYRASSESCRRLVGDGLLLIDSGGQYYNGTTDITRMAGVGVVSDEAKQDVTYVLKAHIALARAVFPVGISATQLDVLARNELWRYGLDYGHGTGHGVGYFLNVHEGPQSISINAPITKERVMLAGMITSNEPGLYREGKWGVRLENLVATVKADSSEFGEFLKFETLTLCPFDTRLILPELLNDDEKQWLNDYHKLVHDRLIDGVSDKARAWLIERTQSI